MPLVLAVKPPQAPEPGAIERGSDRRASRARRRRAEETRRGDGGRRDVSSPSRGRSPAAPERARRGGRELSRGGGLPSRPRLTPETSVPMMPPTS